MNILIAITLKIVIKLVLDQYLSYFLYILSMQSDNCKVAVIILDYNRPDMTELCIKSILSGNEVKVYVVENGRTMRDEFRSIEFKLLRNEVNSFSAGMNAGIRAAIQDGAEYFILLNNDAIVCKFAIRLLVDALKSSDHVGLAAPNREFSTALTSTRKFKRCEDVLNISEMDYYHKPDIRYVSKITGFCMCTKIQVLRRVGLIDEDFIFGKEDDEFSLRIQRAGFNLVEVKNSIVLHTASSSTDFSKITDLKFLLRSVGIGRALLIRKADSNPIKEFGGLLFDIVKITSKSLLFYRKFSFSFVVNGMLGFGCGLLKPIHPPSKINQSS